MLLPAFYALYSEIRVISVSIIRLIIPGIDKVNLTGIEILNHVSAEAHQLFPLGINPKLIKGKSDIAIIEIHKKLTHSISPFLACFPLIFQCFELYALNSSWSTTPSPFASSILMNSSGSLLIEAWMVADDCFFECVRLFFPTR